MNSQGESGDFSSSIRTAIGLPGGAPIKPLTANTRKGKQVMNVKAPDEAARCIPVDGDHVAVVGENRKMLAFPLAQIPEMGRGKGVRLQRYKDGGVSDIKTFTRIVRDGYVPSFAEFSDGRVKTNDPNLLMKFKSAFGL